MKISKVIITLVLTLLTGWSAPLFAIEETASQQSGAKDFTIQASEYIPDEIIIKLKGEAAEVISSTLDSQSLTVKKRNGKLPGFNNKLSKLNDKFKAKSVEPVFKNLHKTIKGKKRSAETQYNKIKKSFPKRSARVDETQRKAPALENIFIIKVEPGADIEAMIAEYSALPEVEYAEPNFVIKLAYTPNDTYFSTTGSWSQSFRDLYALTPEFLDCEAAWNTNQGAGITVAVVDSGLDLTHEDIQGNVWINSDEIAGNNIDDDANGFIDDVNGWNFNGNSANVTDDNGHGSHCAGTIAAVGNNNKGITGVAPAARIMPIKLFDSAGSTGSASSAACITYAADNGADVISNSWGGTFDSVPQTLANAIQYASGLGCVIVAAAGNDSQPVWYGSYPAGFDEVIAVSAVDHEKNLASFSNYGVNIDVAAPGVDILSLKSSIFNIPLSNVTATLGTDYMVISGTSMACPNAAGVVALIMAEHPNYTSDEVRSALRASASEAFNMETGHGIVNADEALTMPRPCVAKISSPGNGEAILPGFVNITGTANGNNFSQYSLDYLAPGTSTWIPVSSGTSALTNGLLGQLDARDLEGLVQFRLRVTNSTNKVFEERRAFRIIGGQQEGWPKPTSSRFASSLVSADLDGDGNKEVLGSAGAIYVWDHQGNILSGWPQSINSSGKGLKSIVTADLDQDNDLEIIITETVFSNFPTGNLMLHILHHDGTPFSANWPRAVSDSPRGDYVSVGDLDGDGAMEIIVSSDTEGTYNLSSKIHAYEIDGTVMNGWPKEYAYHYTRLSYHCLADMDDDGDLDVVVTEMHRVTDGDPLVILTHAFDENGNEITGWPYTYNGEGATHAPPIAADLDKDNSYEIILSYYYGTIVVLNSDGTLFNANWPMNDINDGEDLRMVSCPAVGDLDNDGDLEIIVRYDQLSSNIDSFIGAYDHNSGARVMDYTIPKQRETWWIDSPVYSSPVVGDIDGDDYPEILFGSSPRDRSYTPISKDWEQLFAIDRNGSLIDGWPKYVGGRRDMVSTPCLSDLDNDGDMEVVIGGLDKNAYVYDIEGQYNSGSQDWPMSGSGPENQNRGADPVAVNVTASKSYKSIQSAVNEALDGEEIIIYPGIHKENVTINGKDITLMSKAYYYDLENQETIIDGSGLSSVFTVTNTSEIIFIDLTIQNGYNNPYGGGIYCSGNGLITIEDCIIRDNGAYYSGGGLYSSYSTNVVLENVDFLSNQAVDSAGGAVYISKSNLSVSRCRITDNSSKSTGASIFVSNYNFAGNPVLITNTLIARNTSSSTSLDIRYHSAELNHVTIADNSTRLYFYKSGTGSENVVIKNSIIRNNSATQVYLAGQTDTLITHNIFKNGKAGVEEYLNSGLTFEYNAEDDPLFTDTTDYFIPHYSAAAGSGKVSSVTDDFEGTTRGLPAGTNPDMGYYENPETVGIKYKAHAAGIGWMPSSSSTAWYYDGALAGTTTSWRRMEAIQIDLVNAPADWNVTYRAYVQTTGWQSWVSNGATAGTTGQLTPVYALQVKLENASSTHHVDYTLYAGTNGWTPWQQDGDTAGTASSSVPFVNGAKLKITGGFPGPDAFFRINNSTNPEPLTIPQAIGAPGGGTMTPPITLNGGSSVTPDNTFMVSVQLSDASRNLYGSEVSGWFDRDVTSISAFDIRSFIASQSFTFSHNEYYLIKLRTKDSDTYDEHTFLIFTC